VETQAVWIIVLGTAALMLMGFSLIFFILQYKKQALQSELKLEKLKTEHQQQMLSETLRSAEKERDKIGTELHDSVGAMLSSIKMNLQMERQQAPEDDELMRHLNETINSVRSISHQMGPVILKKYGLKAAIEETLGKINGLEGNVNHWEEPDIRPEDKLMLFRILQESINNTLKHSGATTIKVSCTKNDDRFDLLYEDNGKGFPPEVVEKAEGMGLWNILNRGEVLNATVNFSNPQTGGARINISIPIQGLLKNTF